MSKKVHFSDKCDSKDPAKMLSGLASGSKVELHAAATIESWKIILIELDDNCEKTGETVFGFKMSSKTVELLKLNAFYGLNCIVDVFDYLINPFNGDFDLPKRICSDGLFLFFSIK
jgi:hypothetical protein